MISEKALDIFVGVALFLLLLFGIGALMVWGLNTAFSGPSISSDRDGPPLTKRDGVWIVPSEHQPETVDQMQESAAITLVPYRQEFPPSPKTSTERQALARSVENFLAQWETFDPLEIRAALYRGRADPYRQRLRAWSVPGDLDALAARKDATDMPGACLKCAAGLRWLSAGQVSEALRIGEIEDGRAYVWINGLVRYQARPGDSDPQDGRVFNRTYGLLLNKQGPRWLVSRAVVEPGIPLP